MATEIKCICDKCGDSWLEGDCYENGNPKELYSVGVVYALMPIVSRHYDSTGKTTQWCRNCCEKAKIIPQRETTEELIDTTTDNIINEVLEV